MRFLSCQKNRFLEIPFDYLIASQKYRLGKLLKIVVTKKFIGCIQSIQAIRL
jgi:uncharacterized membrane protein YciS (DUF1049 family)